MWAQLPASDNIWYIVHVATVLKTQETNFQDTYRMFLYSTLHAQVRKDNSATTVLTKQNKMGPCYRRQYLRTRD